MSLTLPHVQVLDHGIHVIDTGFHRPMFDASYLIVERGRAAFVDTGTNHSVPRLLAALDAAGLARDAVDHVIATHVHLDHAGGAGLLMQHLPAATLVVHPHGAPHLIDPARLMNGARAVYGDAEVARSYGELVPVPAARVQRTEDGMTISLAGRALTFLHTPGHARHHHCIWDERSQGFFTGDTFGLSYREFDSSNRMWMMPTTTPVQFEPEPLRRSVQRMLAHTPQRLYLTHYGQVGHSAHDVQRLAALLLQQMDAMVALAVALPDDDQRHALMMRGFGAIHRASLRTHGCTLTDARIDELLALDHVLNAQGMAVWLDRRNRLIEGPPGAPP
jgi:glyoxylase-like metal-dependent hydrolase (beta-lactamase superfamily II)